jgi:hypothetical protein
MHLSHLTYRDVCKDHHHHHICCSVRFLNVAANVGPGSAACMDFKSVTTMRMPASAPCPTAVTTTCPTTTGVPKGMGAAVSPQPHHNLMRPRLCLQLQRQRTATAPPALSSREAAAQDSWELRCLWNRSI